jgi:hypothetical protein
MKDNLIKVSVNDKEGFVDKQEYIIAKTKQLQEFGYPSLTAYEVGKQLDKILVGDKKLSVIGMFMKEDIIPLDNLTPRKEN